jgi:hypothetical protein
VTAGKHLHCKSLAGTKELLRDTKAEGGTAARLEGQPSLPAGKRADTVVIGGLARLALAHDANGNSHENEAAVARKLTRL